MDHFAEKNYGVLEEIQKMFTLVVERKCVLK